ncbi:starvation-inducible DNA-binding protein [Aquimarina sp. MAR_2010_214]|uniref:Dps family protein n=1 Tax=Aquimarina sp. MAR_2010_214 TaxID=1250026 RepID=UPI000C704634|nr:DNA starvation/stationary phase protection protein [Aquimarina sp. MAR_2010_214]PKV50220.1 starvation-inducible DNA-binding protein [Aquimarina sp. MAR_2010_214]
MNYLNMNEKKLLPVVLELNILLADYNLYYQKLRGFHWNILGKNFFDLHHKFEELYNDAKIKIDEIAERILTLQHHPISQFKEYIKMATVEETIPLMKDTEMVKELLEDHKKLLTQMKVVLTHANEAGDEGTIDIIGAYIRELEKLSWMLNAWYKNTADQLDTSLIKES